MSLTFSAIVAQIGDLNSSLDCFDANAGLGAARKVRKEDELRDRCPATLDRERLIRSQPVGQVAFSGCQKRDWFSSPCRHITLIPTHMCGELRAAYRASGVANDAHMI